MSGRYPRVRLVRPTIPEMIERTLRRALSPFAADRFGTVEEFCQALQMAHTPRWRAALLVVALPLSAGY